MLPFVLIGLPSPSALVRFMAAARLLRRDPQRAGWRLARLGLVRSIRGRVRVAGDRGRLALVAGLVQPLARLRSRRAVRVDLLVALHPHLAVLAAQDVVAH